MANRLRMSSSPHLRASVSTRRLMQSVCIALAPAGIAGVILFGYRAAGIIAISVITCILSEYIFERITHKQITVSDWSAVVTGLLLAYNIPANVPLWIPVVGGIIAIVIVKQFFGGIGCNFVNPALTARAIMFVSWGNIMTNYPITRFMPDAVSTATPLALLRNGENIDILTLLIGNHPGVIGETCAIAIVAGGVYLLIRGYADWRIPLCFIGTTFICYLISHNSQFAVAQILSGGLLLGAFFMATDYVTSPMTSKGRIIFGIGCGLMLFIIREFANYIEGCSFAILFLNVLTPLIDRFTTGKYFGEVKHSA